MASADCRSVVAVLEAFFAHPPAGTAAVYLFGSAARDDARPDSDLDVAILFEQGPPRTLAGLHVELADELQRSIGRCIDPAVLNRAPADLVHRVLRDGILVCEPSRSARIRFEVRFRDEYFDMEPIRGMYRGPRPQGTAAEAPSHG